MPIENYRQDNCGNLRVYLHKACIIITYGYFWLFNFNILFSFPYLSIIPKGPIKSGQLYYNFVPKFFFLFTNECTSDCLKNNIKFYIKIASTCFGAVTPSSGRSLSVQARIRWCDCTKTCQSYFNVNFNIVFKTIICEFVGE